MCTDFLLYSIVNAAEVTQMVEIHAWMERFLEELKANFAQHVWFVGLQGSYVRTR